MRTFYRFTTLILTLVVFGLSVLTTQATQAQEAPDWYVLEKGDWWSLYSESAPSAGKVASRPTADIDFELPEAYGNTWDLGEPLVLTSTLTNRGGSCVRQILWSVPATVWAGSYNQDVVERTIIAAQVGEHQFNVKLSDSCEATADSTNRYLLVVNAGPAPNTPKPLARGTTVSVRPGEWASVDLDTLVSQITANSRFFTLHSEPTSSEAQVDTTGLRLGGMLRLRPLDGTPTTLNVVYSVTSPTTNGRVSDPATIVFNITTGGVVVNGPPVCPAQPVQFTGTVGTQIQVPVTGILDPDGDQLSVTWATGTSWLTLSSSTVSSGGFTLTGTPPTTGTHTSTWRVSDPSGLFCTTTVQGTVSNPQVNVPISFSVQVDPVTGEKKARLQVISLSDDEPAGPFTYTWAIVSGPGSGSFTAPSAGTTDVLLSEWGTYTGQVTVDDIDDDPVTKQFQVVVTPPEVQNEPPFWVGISWNPTLNPGANVVVGTGEFRDPNPGNMVRLVLDQASVSKGFYVEPSGFVPSGTVFTIWWTQTISGSTTISWQCQDNQFLLGTVMAESVSVGGGQQEDPEWLNQNDFPRQFCRGTVVTYTFQWDRAVTMSWEKQPGPWVLLSGNTLTFDLASSVAPAPGTYTGELRARVSQDQEAKAVTFTVIVEECGSVCAAPVITDFGYKDGLVYVDFNTTSGQYDGIRGEVSRHYDFSAIYKVFNLSGSRWSYDPEESGRFYLRISTLENGAACSYSDVVEVNVPTSVGTESSGVPETLTLLQNYPNPVNPSTMIRFGLPVAGEIRLEVFNILGQRIKSFESLMSSGWHEVQFEAGDLPSGTYFFRLTAGGRSATKQMAITR